MSHAGHKILFDPFVSRNPHSPRISVPELAQMGDIFITHGHFDHTLDVPEVAALGKSKVYCSAETARQLIKRGAPAQQVVAISPGDIINNGPFTIRVLKGQHIKFDLKLIFQTLFNRRLVNHFRALFNILLEKSTPTTMEYSGA
jgi:L-ascorbate metabolism protein UlaG (beta-lactamase superfamily)